MIMTGRLTGNHVLEIFENFRIDRNLPKHRKPPASNRGFDQNSMKEEDQGKFNDVQWSSGEQLFSNSVEPFVGKTRQTWKHFLSRKFQELLGIAPKPKKEICGNMSPLEVFDKIRNSVKEAEDYTKRTLLYDQEIMKSQSAGQTARSEKLIRARAVVQQESVLISAGFKKFLTEDQVIEFASKCQKGLRLDWIANFGRPIPGSVVSRKCEADQLRIFDNYVVLHYDPTGKVFVLTKEQEIAKKDPILFGVIEDVRKLYFIGDWKSDECDLTMEEVSKVLGYETSEIEEDPTKE